MSNISLPHTWVPLEIPTAANWNANEQEIQTKFNSFAVQTDVAKTITVSHQWNAAQNHGGDILFTDALYDIGKSGATRPRDGFFSRNLTVGGTSELYGRITVNGTPTSILQQILGSSSVAASIGTAYSSGLLSAASNAYQSGANGSATDDWTQSFTGLGSGLIQPNNFGFVAYSRAAGASPGTFVAFWGAPKFEVSVGIVLVGTTVTTGANAGDIVLSNSAPLRGVNAAGTNTIGLIKAGGSNEVAVASSAILTIGNPSAIASAAAGDAVLANAKSLRGVNAAGTDTYPLIQFTSADNVQLGNSSRVVGIGAPGSYVSATGGELVLGNAKSLRGVNVAGTSTRRLIGINTVNFVELAPDGDPTGVQPAAKFYLDGGSDTYITEGAADALDIRVGGVLGIQFKTTYNYTTQDFIIEAAKFLRLDGNSSGDTHISEAAANDLRFTVGGAVPLQLLGTTVYTNVPLFTTASVAGGAGIRAPHGTAPSAPVDGDVWTTTAGLFVRINGVTKTVTLT